MLRPFSTGLAFALPTLLGLCGVGLGLLGASRNSAGSVAFVIGAGLTMLGLGVYVTLGSVVCIRHAALRSSESHGWIPLSEVIDVRVERERGAVSAVIETRSGVFTVWHTGPSLLGGLMSGWHASDLVRYLRQLPELEGLPDA